MIDVGQDIHSLSSFERNTTDFIRQMKETDQSVVLTINGKAEFIVQDAGSYQKLLELVDRLETIEAIRQGLEEMKAGEGIPVEEAFKELRAKLGAPQKA
jgi:PHD/YefM family antitoxin component YafN of YafNO toxin-antitoxin module